MTIPSAFFLIKFNLWHIEISRFYKMLHIAKVLSCYIIIHQLSLFWRYWLITVQKQTAFPKFIRAFCIKVSLQQTKICFSVTDKEPKLMQVGDLKPKWQVTPKTKQATNIAVCCHAETGKHDWWEKRHWHDKWDNHQEWESNIPQCNEGGEFQRTMLAYDKSNSKMMNRHKTWKYQVLH